MAHPVTNGRQLVASANVQRSQADSAKAAYEAKQSPPSELAGFKPTSIEEARELFVRACVEIALQPESLRALRKLLRSKNERTRGAMWEALFERVLPQVKDGGNQRPTSIQINNLMARPAGVVVEASVEET